MSLVVWGHHKGWILLSFIEIKDVQVREESRPPQTWVAFRCTQCLVSVASDFSTTENVDLSLHSATDKEHI